MFMTFKQFILGLCLLVILSAVCILQGCSVNVVVAPHATLGVHSDLSQTATQRNVGTYVEEAPLYDCVAGPAADVCQ